MRVLVLNSGSSSIKYKLFDMDGEAVLAKGAIAGIGGKASSSGAMHAKDHSEGLALAFDAIATAHTGHIDAIGHRVVHGGPAYSAPVPIDDDVCRAIGDNAPFAPLHNPPNLLGIEAARRLRPGTPQIAVFDTAFHRTLPPVAATYALPRELSGRHGIRRYGFHGTSCSWSLGAAAAFLDRRKADLNLIVAHLGAGASVTAIRGGISVDTSMGLSTLEGLMMQTRAGDLDPAIPILLLREGMTADELDRVLNRESGVKGIAGEADMLTVAQRAASGDADAAFARQMYAYRAGKQIGAYASVVWPLDALVFTGGVGENDAGIREAICASLPQLGLILDQAANRRPQEERVRSIRSGGAGPEILIVEADEELEIARETVAVVRGVAPNPHAG